MKVVLQRVTQAQVLVDGKVLNQIQQGLVLFVGIAQEDTEAEIHKMAEKIVKIRVFSDDDGKINHNVMQINGELLVISQFTLLADLKGQNRPYFGLAAEPKKAESLIQEFVDCIKKQHKLIKTGQFGAHMDIKLTNDGPVTLVLESEQI